MLGSVLLMSGALRNTLYILMSQDSRGPAAAFKTGRRGVEDQVLNMDVSKLGTIHQWTLKKSSNTRNPYGDFTNNGITFMHHLLPSHSPFHRPIPISKILSKPPLHPRPNLLQPPSPLHPAPTLLLDLQVPRFKEIPQRL